MVITTIGIGIGVFCLQTYNALKSAKSSQKVRECYEDYQRSALENNFKHAMELSEQIQKERLDILANEQAESKQLMADLHHQNLLDVAKLSSLGNWPLSVMPLVMRDDSLFGTETSSDCYIPVNVIFGPCRDRTFQTAIWKAVEDNLSVRFMESWNSNTKHQILFYQDAWKNEWDDADSTQRKNIQAKIAGVPTIILSPIITKSGLHIDITHWGLSSEGSTNNRIDICSNLHHYAACTDYETVDVEPLISELSDIVEIMIGCMDDQYMWFNHHNVLPLLPRILAIRNNLDDKSRLELYEKYVEMLNVSLSTSQLHAVFDLELILSYCNLIDLYGQGDKAFQIVAHEFLGDCFNHPRDGVPSHENSKLIMFLNYMIKNKDSLSLKDEFINDMKFGMFRINLYLKSNETLLKNKNEYIQLFICKIHDTLVSEIRSTLAKDLDNNEAKHIEKGRSLENQNQNYDIRNCIRPEFNNGIRDAYKRALLSLANGIAHKMEEFEYAVTSDVLQSLQREIETLLFPLNDEETVEVFEICRKQLLDDIKSKKKTVNTDFLDNEEDVYNIRAKMHTYREAILKAWIEYNMFSKDMVYKNISPSERKNINELRDELTETLSIVSQKWIRISYDLHSTIFSLLNRNKVIF